MIVCAAISPTMTQKLTFYSSLTLNSSHPCVRSPAPRPP